MTSVKARCILGKCPHETRSCDSLGVCGAERALKLSGFGDGYEVSNPKYNPTVKGLVSAGMARVDNRFGRFFLVKEVE